MRESFWDRLRNIVPSRYDDPDVRLFKVLIYIFVGAVFLMIIAGLTSFFFSLRGAEETMVPDVLNEKAVDAVLALQERGLIPHLEVRYSADPSLAGKVIAQTPPAGTLVRAGKTLQLIVSLGARVDRIGTYVDRSLTDVRAELRALFASGEQTIAIGNVIYDFDEAEPGTVLAQNPSAGTEISEITQVSLVVSRGPDVKRIELPSFVGLQFRNAIARLSQNNIPFTFDIRDAAEDEASGLIVAQSPDPGEEVAVGSFVSLTMTRPSVVPDGEVFGVLDRSLPEYAVEVDLTLESQSPNGDRAVLFTMLHPGIKLTVPYQVRENSSLILYRSGEEIYRTIVRKVVSTDGGQEPLGPEGQ
ncbi:MAG: PASTA domain-containing protein [Spirochaetales bacterium]|nr:MAG: PASTA domain-containing protein [Spirochaetales bacterium]